MSSAAEIAYTLHGAAQDVREDGRQRLDFRCVSLEVGVFQQASGSSRLQLGSTHVLVGVVAELGEPAALAPAAGRISVSVGCGPGEAASNGLPTYGGSDAALSWIESALQPLYSIEAIPSAIEALCIVRGVQCWNLRVHVQLLRCDGCPLDAAALAINAALHHTRVPKIVLTAAGGSAASKQQLDLDLDESLNESTLFDASSLPLYVTLGTIGSHMVADCTAAERRAVGTALSLALNADGGVCALRMTGAYGVNVALMADMLQTARYLCAGLLTAARAAIADAMRASEQRGFPHADGSTIGLLAA